MAGPIETGQAVLKFGTDDDATYGILDDITTEEEAGEKTEIKDGDGDTVGLIFADLKTKVTAAYTPLTGADLNAIKPGSEITVDGNTLRVDTASKKSVKGGITTWSVTGYVYPNLAS